MRPDDTPRKARVARLRRTLWRWRTCRNNDSKTLDAIAEMLRDPDWGVGMLEDIADLVRGSGRTVENYPDDRPTWDRH